MNMKWLSIGNAAESLPAHKSISYFETTATIFYRSNGVWQITDAMGNPGQVMYDMPESGNISDVGAPMLVREGVFVAIPIGKKYSHIEIVKKTDSMIDSNQDILPVPEPTLETEEPHYIKNDNIYNSNSIYPAVDAEFAGVENIMGVNCVHLFIYPMHYNPADRTVALTSDLEVQIHFEDDKAGITGTTTKVSSYNKMSSNLILGYDEVVKPLLSESNSVLPSLLIITTDELAYSMRIYEGKRKFLYDVDLVLTSDIYAQYPNLSKDEAIRTFLDARYQIDNISYVVLGGDVDQIPTHKDSEGFASDSYYCTDGTTVLPRFVLSRFPARNREELNGQTDIATYYDRFYDEYKRHTAVFTSYNDSSRGYEQCKEAIAANAENVFAVIKRYDGKYKKAEVINAIESGVSFINYRGHGSNTRWSASNGLKNEDVENLDVGNDTPIVLSIACDNNNIYVPECFGACWIRKYKAVAFLGASTDSYTYVNHYFDKYLWEAILVQKLSIIGDIYLWATLKLYQNDDSTYSQMNIREYLVLGDILADYLDDDSTRDKT